MNSIKISTLLIVAGIFTLGACTSKNEKGAATEQADSLKAALVKTSIVKSEVITRNIEYTASLIAFEEVHLAPSSPGRIEKINVDISDNVSKGQVVAIMDRTNLETARINLMKLETDYKRLDTLKKTKSIADQQYDQVKAAYDLAKNSYQLVVLFQVNISKTVKYTPVRQSLRLVSLLSYLLFR